MSTFTQACVLQNGLFVNLIIGTSSTVLLAVLREHPKQPLPPTISTTAISKQQHRFMGSTGGFAREGGLVTLQGTDIYALVLGPASPKEQEETSGTCSSMPALQLVQRCRLLLTVKAYRLQYASPVARLV